MDIPQWLLGLIFLAVCVLLGRAIRLYRTRHSWMRKYRDDQPLRSPSHINKYRRRRPPLWFGGGPDCVEPEKGSYGARGPVGSDVSAGEEDSGDHHRDKGPGCEDGNRLPVLEEGVGPGLAPVVGQAEGIGNGVGHGVGQ